MLRSGDMADGVMWEAVVSLVEDARPAGSPVKAVPAIVALAPSPATLAGAVEGDQRRARGRVRMPSCATDWGFWLTLTLACLFRLPPLRYSPFGIDTALLF